MKKNKLIELTLKQMLNYHLLNHCTNCGSQRIKVTFEELPEDMKKEVSNLKKEDIYFLYCNNCKEHAMVFYE